MRFKYSFALLLAFVCLQLAAQQTSFRISYDIANLDIPGNVIQNPTGNYVFAGTNANFIPLYGNVTQIDSLGNIIWSKGYSGGSVATDIWDIKNVSGGGYITAGSTGGSGLMLMRLTSTGTVTWSNRYHITSGTDEYSSRVLPTSDGGFVVAGYVYGATPPSATKQDSANFFCLKVNSSGTLQWAKVFFYTTAYINDHVLNDVAEVSDGYIFGGYASQSAVDDDGTDAVLLKTDLNGNLQWMKKWGSSSSSQSVNALVALSSTEVMASGDDNSKMFYEKVTASGTSIGGYIYTFPGLLSVATAYNGFVTNDGNYGFIGSDIVPLSFAFNSFVMKVSSANGNVSFARTFNSGLSSILPEGGQVSDSGYIMIMTAQQMTGFNYHVAKCDKSGVMNNTNCESSTVSPSKSSYAPSFTSVTPPEISSATTNAITVVVANLSPTKTVDCITVQCNNPATPTASASPNPICAGQSTTISGSGSGTGVTYKVYTAASGGTLLGTAPLSVSPGSTTTYYVEAESNSVAGCVSLARGSVTVTVNNPPAAVGSITGATSPCPGSQTYSISSVSGATGYTWSVSAGGTITGGQGTTSITVNWTTAGGPYTVSVTASNSCGSTSATTAVTVQNGPPAAVGTITGSNNPCPGSQTYTIASVANATSYTWSVSAGGSITAGQGTTSATINWTTSGGPYTVSVVAANSCGNTSNTLTVNVQPGPPAAVGSITGTTSPCPGSQTYSIGSVSGATSYTWAVSAGGTITGGQGTTGATINWTTTGGPYTVSVTASNSCGSTSATTAVTVQNGPPAAVGAISGTNNPCPGSQTYTIANVANAGSYTWSVSGGGSITAGQGTTSVTIDWTTSGGPYTVSVVAANSCGNTSNTVSVNVQPGPPAAVGTISGNSNPCPGSQAYSISAVAGATSYTWAVSAGGTITGGQGTTSATINWTAAGGPYTVSVTATNSCGSTSNTLPVTVQNGGPSSVGAIAGSTNPCPGTQTYSIGNVTNATSYNWSVSGGGTISGGQGTTSISVTWTTSGGPYTVSVTASNSCGSVSNTTSVTVAPPAPVTPGAITGDTVVCTGNEVYSISPVANATSYTWAVSGGGTITAGQGTNNATINWTTAGTYSVSVLASNSCGSSSNAVVTIQVTSAAPTNLGAISGPSPICHGTGTYTVGNATGATTYNWTVGSPGTITGGQGTATINVNWPATAGTFPITVTAANVCGNSSTASYSVTVVDTVPLNLGAITGNNNPCPGSQNYSIPSVNGATGYTWSVSAGGTISAGQGTNSVTVNWNTAGGPYTLSVSAENTCGSSVPASLQVNVQSGSAPVAGAITGDTLVCPSQQVYSIPVAAGATGYNWTVSNGGTITAGTGTNSITVNWTQPGGPYAVSVVVTGACSNSQASTLNVTVKPGAPVTPGTIAGNITTCGSDTASYAVASVPNATVYTWSISNGGTLLSAQGTNTADIFWGATPGTYTVSVTAGNDCGTSGPSTLTVTVLAPAPVMSTTIQGDTGVCPGTASYTIAAVPNATTYNWSLGSGGTIAAGQGSTTVTINWTTAGSHTLTVTASNNCGQSQAATLQVNVHPSPSQPLVTLSDDTICEGQQITITASGSSGGIVAYVYYDAVSAGNLVGTNPLTVSPAQTTTYYLEVSNQYGCVYNNSRVPVTVVVLKAPTVTITTEGDSICYGSTTTFTATPNPANAGVSWYDAATAGNLLASATSYTVGPLTQNTTVYAQVSDANGCAAISGRVPVTADVKALPVVTLSSDKDNNTLLPGEAITFTASPAGYGNYEFFVNGVSVQSGSNNTWASSKLSDKDTVSVIATDNGCNSYASDGVVHLVDFPNAFTPNNDGTNDVFLKNYDLIILNRWGQELYRGHDGWDGTYNGDKASPGTYYYIVTLKNITDRDTQVKGNVLLIQD